MQPISPRSEESKVNEACKEVSKQESSLKSIFQQIVDINEYITEVPFNKNKITSEHDERVFMEENLDRVINLNQFKRIGNAFNAACNKNTLKSDDYTTYIQELDRVISTIDRHFNENYTVSNIYLIEKLRTVYLWLTATREVLEEKKLVFTPFHPVAIKMLDTRDKMLADVKQTLFAWLKSSSLFFEHVEVISHRIFIEHPSFGRFACVVGHEDAQFNETREYWMEHILPAGSHQFGFVLRFENEEAKQLRDHFRIKLGLTSPTCKHKDLHTKINRQLGSP